MTSRVSVRLRKTNRLFSQYATESGVLARNPGTRCGMRRSGTGGCSGVAQLAANPTRQETEDKRKGVTLCFAMMERLFW